MYYLPKFERKFMQTKKKGQFVFSPVFLSLQCLLVHTARLVKQKIDRYYKLNDSLSFSSKAVCVIKVLHRLL